MRLFFAKFSAALRAGFYLYVFLLPANTTKLELKRFATNKTPLHFFMRLFFAKFSPALRAGFYLYVLFVCIFTTKLELKRFATNKPPLHFFMHYFSQISNQKTSGGFIKGGLILCRWYNIYIPPLTHVWERGSALKGSSGSSSYFFYPTFFWRNTFGWKFEDHQN